MAVCRRTEASVTESIDASEGDVTKISDKSTPVGISSEAGVLLAASLLILMSPFLRQ